jgi:alpha-amylase/alpha-mannosidase (GH57 family)
MSFPLYVAFIWHQHQPLYKSPITGKYRMPWVRLHGVKDYLDLPLILSRFPQIHQTFNLVPSLILQIQDYVSHRAWDPYVEALLTPIDRMDLSQRRFVVEHGFDAYGPTMVEPYPRYESLRQQVAHLGVQECAERWTESDFSDVLMWHNLTWIDPLFRHEDPAIAHWFDRGEGFSLGDRQLLYAKHRELMARILPCHRQLQDRGQIEIATSPYTHPILPLLADNHSGRVAVPQMLLPGLRFRWEQDISLHLEKSRQVYEHYFGRSPRGLWPSEQSVSPAILPYVSRQGYSWLCSDEGVLGWSLGKYFRRDDHGAVIDAPGLYQPYRLETLYGDVAMVFRDRRLSDLIGFSYASMPPEKASADLVDHLLRLQQQHQHQDPDRPWLVTIALDGENCWEYYERDGYDFLTQLYTRLSAAENLRCVTVSEFLELYPPTECIPPHQLHSGSWIDANFTTWIGDPIKNRAWDLLAEARQVLANHPEATRENNPEVWEHLLAAEGSDWFWWFGEGHSSSHDSLFDQLFREHLQAIYQSLNEQIPISLLYPLEPHDLPRSDRPLQLISPTIDGIHEKSDWQRAGRIAINAARGTMQQGSPVNVLLYGYDHFHLYLRLEPSALGKQAPFPLVHLFLFYPEQVHFISPMPLAGVPAMPPLNYLFRHHVQVDATAESVTLFEAIAHQEWQPRQTHSKISWRQCWEFALPWADLGARPQTPARLLIILSEGQKYLLSLPEYGIIPLEVP